VKEGNNVVGRRGQHGRELKEAEFEKDHVTMKVSSQ
jgi:hypothetical protein